MSDPISIFDLGGGTMNFKLYEENNKIRMVGVDTAGDDNAEKTVWVDNLHVAGNVIAVIQYSENMHEDGTLDTVPMFKATYDFVKASEFANFLP